MGLCGFNVIIVPCECKVTVDQLVTQIRDIVQHCLEQNLRTIVFANINPDALNPPIFTLMAKALSTIMQAANVTGSDLYNVAAKYTGCLEKEDYALRFLFTSPSYNARMCEIFRENNINPSTLKSLLQNPVGGTPTLLTLSHPQTFKNMLVLKDGCKDDLSTVVADDECVRNGGLAAYMLGWNYSRMTLALLLKQLLKSVLEPANNEQKDARHNINTALGLVADFMQFALQFGVAEGLDIHWTIYVHDIILSFPCSTFAEAVLNCFKINVLMGMKQVPSWVAFLVRVNAMNETVIGLVTVQTTSRSVAVVFLTPTFSPKQEKNLYTELGQQIGKEVGKLIPTKTKADSSSISFFEELREYIPKLSDPSVTGPAAAFALIYLLVLHTKRGTAKELKESLIEKFSGTQEAHRLMLFEEAELRTFFLHLHNYINQGYLVNRAFMVNLLRVCLLFLLIITAMMMSRRKNLTISRWPGRPPPVVVVAPNRKKPGTQLAVLCLCL